MLWLFWDKRPWFGAKTYGYGAGLPIAWQGWALLASYAMVMAGLGVLALSQPGTRGMALLAPAVFSTLIFLLTARRRTRGGWKWRWGNRD